MDVDDEITADDTKALSAKFDQNNSLHKRLFDTNQRKFVETNQYDQFWSIGKGNKVFINP